MIAAGAAKIFAFSDFAYYIYDVFGLSPFLSVLLANIVIGTELVAGTFVLLDLK